MRLEDMIMVVEKRKGTETNFLTDLLGYMEMAVKACEDSVVDLSDAIKELYGTKEGSNEWSKLYFRGNRSAQGAFCSDAVQLRGFLKGNFNKKEWTFDESRCGKECLEVLGAYGMKTDGHSLFMHYERVEHTFQNGETFRNMNGKDYRVLAVLGPKDLLLLGQTDNQLVIGRDVQFFDRCPKGESPTESNTLRGVEWGDGIYLGSDITKLDFDILRQEYGEPDRAENISHLRDKIQREFWMHKNVEQKEGLLPRVRAAAKDSLECTFGTSDPDVFVAMLDKGLYDEMNHGKEEQKKYRKHHADRGK